MTWVKICGMTNLEDALVAVDAGADAVGFVFYEKSPRCVTVQTAREICEKLPEGVEKIGVFVGSKTHQAKVLLEAQLTGMQCYLVHGGSASGNDAIGRDALPPGFRQLLAFPIKLFSEPQNQIPAMVEEFAESMRSLPVPPPENLLDTFLLDSGNAQQPGGTGRTFDWKTAGPISESMRRHGLKLVVAGGLRPDNVGEAISALKPWGVDVVSGVEASPGKKDPEKVRAFVRAVRECDRKVG